MKSISMGTCVTLIVCLWLWTSLVLTGSIDGIDYRLLSVLRTEGEGGMAVPVGPSWLPMVFKVITHIGGSAVLIVVSALTILVAFLKGLRGKGLYFAAGAYASVFLITPVFKIIFDRARPDVFEHLVHVSTNSYPSGHALRSAVVYLVSYAVLSRFFVVPSYVKKSVFALILLIGFSRLYLSVHWPSDIVGGWLFAGLWLSVWLPLLKNTQEEVKA